MNCLNCFAFDRAREEEAAAIEWGRRYLKKKQKQKRIAQG